MIALPNNKYNNLPGMKFNSLTVIDAVGNDNHGAKLWKCKCDCGNYTIQNTSNIISSRSKSCGCLKGYNLKTHGYSRERLHNIWKGMRGRCNNSNESSYKNYGARGIKVCEEWNDYTVFRKWALENGYNDSLTIERKDVNKGYEPSNCEWITLGEQCNNRRNTVRMTYKGQTKTLSQWSKEFGINYFTLYRRYCEYGWSVEKCLNTHRYGGEKCSAY